MQDFFSKSVLLFLKDTIHQVERKYFCAWRSHSLDKWGLWCFLGGREPALDACEDFTSRPLFQKEEHRNVSESAEKA